MPPSDSPKTPATRSSDDAAARRRVPSRGRAAFRLTLGASFFSVLFLVSSFFLYSRVAYSRPTAARPPYLRGPLTGVEIVRRPEALAKVFALGGPVYYVLLAASVGFFLAAVAANLRAKQHVRTIVLLPIVLLPFAGYQVSLFRTYISDFVLHETMTSSDGRTFCLLVQRNLTDGFLALAVPAGRSASSAMYNVLGAAYSDAPAFDLPLVRPENSVVWETVRPIYGETYLIPPRAQGTRLVQCDKGRILVLSGNRCCVAYDPTADRTYGDATGFVSPFALLGSDARLCKHDADEVRRKLMRLYSDRAQAYRFGPNLRSVRADLEERVNHPNPEVRRLAVEFLDLTSTASLAKSP